MFDANMNILKKEYEKYYNTIKKYIKKNNNDLEVIQSKDNRNNLKIKRDNKEIYLHSYYSVENEAARWSDNIDKNKDIYLVFGAGFFYHINRLIEDMPENNKTFIVVENDIDIFVKAMENVDIRKYLTDLRVILILSNNPDEISETLFYIMKSKGIRSLEVCTLMSYQQLYKEWLDETYNAIVQMLQLFGMNIATELHFCDKWLYNQFQNIKSLNMGSFPLEYFFNKFKKIPAIVVGAGPSLDKQLEILKKYKNKALIFAAGSSINILEKNGIIPHFEVAVDGGITEAKILENVVTDKTVLLFSSTVHHEAVKRYKGRKMWFRGNNYSVLDYFEKYIGMNSKRVELGPSCVNIAVDIARKFDCYPIMLIGQDMAYTDKKLYSEGPKHNKNLKDETRTKVLSKDIYGNEIYTLNSFIGIKDFFEMYVRTNKLQNKLINCTEGGLGISNVKNEKFEEYMLKLNCIEFDVNKYINKLYNENEKETSSKLSGKTFKFIEKIKKSIKKIEQESKKRVKIVNETLDNFDKLSLTEIKEYVSEITKITDYIEKNEIHNEAMKYSTAAYSLAIKNGVHKQLQSIIDLRNKYKLLLNGLRNEYVFYDQLLHTLEKSLNE